MTWNGWSGLNWWLNRSRRLVHVALLVLVHKRLHAGLNRVSSSAASSLQH